MVGVRSAGHRIDHRLGIAVVRGDERDAPAASHRRDDLAHRLVDGLDRTHRSLEHAGVPDHVAVGEVHDVDVGLVAFDRRDEFAQVGRAVALWSGVVGRFHARRAPERVHA